MKKISRKNIVKRLDTVFSLYIRLREADNEMVECFTCGKISHYKKNMQCGHFQSRSSYSTRWDPNNCQVQCYATRQTISIWFKFRKKIWKRNC